MFLIDRRYIRYFDWYSFALLLLISCVGLLFVFSATYTPEQPYSLYFKKQLFGICSGVFIYFGFCFMDYRKLLRLGYFMYFAIIVLLLFTTIKGSIAMGGKRWINLFIFKFQPSEIAKLFFPAFIAHYFETENSSGRYTFKEFLPPLGILGLSFILIAKQPDLGTAIILAGSGFILVWLAGMPRMFFVLSAMMFLITAPVLWNFFLKDYQKKRITVFLGQGDKRKERYQIEQSKIAIGSGGFFGKGFLKGTQNKYLFLPESRTDFIFSVLAEEWGFVGCMFTLLLFLLLFIRLFYVITTIPNFFAQLLACGLVIHVVISTLINLCMILQLLPAVGIPLPLMSYGISHLWITFASLGWFNGIAIARFYLGKQ
jgi:rod shape determining protein RodA